MKKKQTLLICILTLIFSNVNVAPAQSDQKLSTNDFTFQLNTCKLSGGSITCQFIVTNDSSADRRFILYARGYSGNSRMFDDGGNEYIATQAQVGTKVTEGGAEIVLVPQVPVKGSIRFDKVNSEATKITLLRLSCGSTDARGNGQNGWNADFRNVPITK